MRARYRKGTNHSNPTTLPRIAPLGWTCTTTGLVGPVQQKIELLGRRDAVGPRREDAPHAVRVCLGVRGGGRGGGKRLL